MINLLPPKEKEEFELEIKKNLSITLGGMFLIFLICFILVLFSLNLYILGEADSKSIILSQSEKNYQKPELSAFKEDIQNYNKELTRMSYFYENQISFSNALKIISGIERPEGLYFTNFQLDRGKGKLLAVISGFSGNREDLLSFKANIERESEISNIYFSPASWIKPLNVSFNLTFEIKETQNAK